MPGGALIPFVLSALTLSSAALIPLRVRQVGDGNNDTSSGSSLYGPYGLDNDQCQELNVQVAINSTNIKYTDVDQNYSNQSNWTEAHVKGENFQNNKTYRIHGYYCEPKENAKNGSALINLVHGIGFDSSYWDFDFAPEYSFVKHAASYGYSTFRYDRLGTGKSQTPENGFDETQAATEVAILTEILTKLRNSTEIGGNQHESIVGVGHSYGSVQTQAVTAANPELLDAAILTGFTANSTNLPGYLQAGTYSIANQTLVHLEYKPSTWLATDSVAGNIVGFFWPPFYDKGAFQLARQTEQPVTLSSLTSIGTVGGPAKDFNKPVQMVNGAKDFIFCTSNRWAGANGTDIPSLVKDLYPQAQNFTSYIAEDTGHGITCHYSQPIIAKAMMEYIASNGL